MKSKKKSSSSVRAVQLNLVFSEEEKMRFLNKQFRGEEGTTDVLAFPAQLKIDDNLWLLGEIVVNLEQAAKQARQYQVSLSEEVVRLFVHGLLHLLGYSDTKPAERQKMHHLQEKIIQELQELQLLKANSLQKSPPEIEK